MLSSHIALFAAAGDSCSGVWYTFDRLLRRAPDPLRAGGSSRLESFFSELRCRAIGCAESRIRLDGGGERCLGGDLSGDEKMP
jgi:hypothetical protein